MQVHQAYQAAKYQTATAMLPDLVRAADRYRQRNTVERAVSKLKQFRAVATRYDKRAFMYLATVDVAIIKIWLRDPAQGHPSA